MSPFSERPPLLEEDEVNAAAQRCQEAFEAHPEATWAWCCHHEVQLEPLIESFRDRVDYILSYKLREELVTRLDNFRPVTSAVPPELLDAGREYREARLGHSDWQGLANSNKWKVLHDEQVPGNTWDGMSIF